MTNELGTLLEQAAQELSPDEPMDDLGLARIVRSVRRRRVQRHTMESVVGVAAAGVVGTAAWAGLRYTAPAPADTPTPSVSVTPTPTPTPSVTATPTPTPTSTQPPVVQPVPPTFGQVATQPATPALVAGATPGWVLAIEAPVYYVEGSDLFSTSAERLLLLSPAGDRYKLLDLRSGDDDKVLGVLHWTAGDDRALVLGADSEPRWLDLSTGTLSAVPGTPANARWIGVASTGNLIWQTAMELVAVTPDGAATTLAYTLPQTEGELSPDRSYVYAGGGVVDLRTGAKQFFQPPEGADGSCLAGGWLSSTQVVVQCGSGLYASTFTPVWDPPTMPQATPVFADLGWTALSDVLPLADGRHVVSAIDESGWGLWAVTGTSVTEVMAPLPDVGDLELTTSGNRVITRPAGGGEAAQFPLTAHDATTGKSTVLMPMPDESGEPYGLAKVTWVDMLADWVVGTSY
ncbi:hypothetical protein [uncultured Cellulomonas sp.]|uniref:hypothetical protein n=1 Tax=uncultured Cellulomonas sp. TaxID=189682 RepID=UPI0028F0DA1F|nr:hypothetical protein [uncultured Cellulomonas sp.]